MRGLACVLMSQTHCYDAWLGGEARKTRFPTGSQLLGTLPAPLFLFLAGVSFALVTDKLIRKGLAFLPQSLAPWLGAAPKILSFGLLFRLQNYLIAWGWAGLVGLTARGRPEYHRPLHDPDGAALRPDDARLGTRVSVGTGDLARPSRAKLGRS